MQASYKALRKASLTKYSATDEPPGAQDGDGDSSINTVRAVLVVFLSSNVSFLLVFFCSTHKRRSHPNPPYLPMRCLTLLSLVFCRDNSERK
jgi:hypothetical protein